MFVWSSSRYLMVVSEFEGIMIDENAARLRARRQNIDRYTRLLRTNLTDVERDFIERRIAEEQSARAASDFEALSGELRCRTF